MFADARGYAHHNEHQRRQSARLIGRLQLTAGQSVLDVGCGDGRITAGLAARFPGVRVHGIDISPEMITHARATVGGSFEVADLLEYQPGQRFDVVFSNSAMHWMVPPERAYRRVFAALVDGGTMAVQQGAAGCYRQLWDCAEEVLRDLGLGGCLAGWAYPAHYPTAAELAELLTAVGFVAVSVGSARTWLARTPELFAAFSHAGLLPYTRQVPAERRAEFRAAFISRAGRSTDPVFEHRLYALARRPDTSAARPAALRDPPQTGAAPA
ncbi:hypothetical protein GCM10009682_56300 [Luedemannella flava]|uniref:Methyltransferase domain-containing protein n=1 Tax=Luedemannella flava TaxID=349316 RepID=A0ABN2MK91_9ACTN